MTTQKMVEDALSRLAAWASLIERPSKDGDERLLVDASVAAEHAADIRTILAALARKGSA